MIQLKIDGKMSQYQSRNASPAPVEGSENQAAGKNVNQSHETVRVIRSKQQRGGNQSHHFAARKLFDAIPDVTPKKDFLEAISD
jgi:hypothetical protein